MSLKSLVSNYMYDLFYSVAVCLCTAVSMQYLMAEENPAAQRQTTVTAHLKSKQLLLFVFAWWSVCSTRWQKRILQLKGKQQ